MEDFIILYSTFPRKRIAKKIARTFIREKLIACSNIFKLDSLYRWQDTLEESSEYGAFMKTRKSLYRVVETRIRELHPYECPAIIQIPITRGYTEYLSWVENETKENPL